MTLPNPALLVKRRQRLPAPEIRAKQNPLRVSQTLGGRTPVRTGKLNGVNDDNRNSPLA